MYDLPKCDTEGCPGHLGKFSDCVAEAVYQWSMDGSNDGQTGESDFQGHFSLYIVTNDETVCLDTTRENEFKVTVPAGNYILYGASSGAVSLWTYETEAEARAEFEAQDEAYSKYLDEDEEI